MVAGEISSPRLRSPEAISVCDHCDSTPGGTEVAIAMTANRVPGPCTAGRPDRGLSKMPGIPSLADRPRHFRTTLTLQPRSRAICAFPPPRRGGQHDPGPQHQPLRAGPRRDDLPQLPVPLDRHPYRHRPGAPRHP